MKNSLLKQDISYIYNKSASGAERAFPDRLNNLLLVSTQAPIYVSPAMAGILTKSTQAVKNLITEGRNYMQNRNAIGFADRFAFVAQRLCKVIALNEKVTIYASFTKYTDKMDLIHTLDHEIGHLAVAEGDPVKSSRHIAECAADAYAALRHVQRFGKDTDFYDAYNKSSAIVLGTSPIHYTDSITQKIARLCEKKDISKLTLQETAKLAGKIARKYAHSETTMLSMKNAFYPVEQMYKLRSNYKDPAKRKKVHELPDSDRNAILNECIKVMIAHKNNHDVYRAGKLFLRRKDNRELIAQQSKTDPFWPQALALLESIEKEERITLDPAKAREAEKRRMAAALKKNIPR